MWVHVFWPPGGAQLGGVYFTWRLRLFGLHRAAKHTRLMLALEVVTLPSLIGQIWLWRSEATFSSRTPQAVHDPPPPKNILFSLRLTVKLKTKVKLASKD